MGIHRLDEMRWTLDRLNGKILMDWPPHGKVHTTWGPSYSSNLLICAYCRGRLATPPLSTPLILPDLHTINYQPEPHLPHHLVRRIEIKDTKLRHSIWMGVDHNV